MATSMVLLAFADLPRSNSTEIQSHYWEIKDQISLIRETLAQPLTAEEVRAGHRLTTLPIDFERLSTDHNLMICEIIHGLLPLLAISLATAGYFAVCTAW